MNSKFLFGTLLITGFSLFFVMLQYLAINGNWTNGLFVVDAVSLKRSLLFYDVINTGFSSLTAVINQVLSFYALFILYWWTGSEFGFIWDFGVNLILTILAWKNTIQIAKLEAGATPNLLFYVSIFWFLNPYYLSVMMFPNKEILLFFLTTACAKNMISGRYLIGIICIVLAYFTRDGHALALLCASAAYVAMKHFKIKGWLVVLTALVLVASFSVNDFAQLGGAFERNAYMGSSKFGYHSDPGSNSNILVSSIVNWLNFAFRPQFFGPDGIYLINFGFWLTGITVFFVLPLAYLTVWNSVPKNLFSSLLIFSISLALVVSSYSQQRYFLPFLPLILIILTSVKPKFVFAVLAFSLMIYPILNMLEILPPIQMGVSSQSLREIGF